jgi:hypothetical protein
MPGQANTKRYHTSVSEIWLDDEAIMHIVFAKGVTITLPDMEEAYKLFGDLGFGAGKKKSRQLLSGGPFNISKEARDYAGKNATDYFIAAAMVTDSILMRYVINLFNSIQKHDVPFKLFSSEEDAIEWLRTFR